MSGTGQPRQAGAKPAGGRVARVIVASTRAAAGAYLDRTGPVIDAWLGERGWLVLDRAVVADGEPVGDAISAAVEAGLDLVITTGGTGVSPTDRTPEQTLPLLERQLPGIMEELRRRGTASTPLAVLSRGHAGIARGGTVVINLPGSTGGVRDGLSVLEGVLDHLLDQVRGADHATPPDEATPTGSESNVAQPDHTESIGTESIRTESIRTESIRTDPVGAHPATPDEDVQHDH